MKYAAHYVQRCLEAITIFLLVSLAVVVLLAVGFRFSGSSLIWYDEVASVMLAWITYYRTALAAVRRSHLGFSGFVLCQSLIIRQCLFLFSEIVVYAFFILMAYASWYVLRIMEGETLVSLEWISLTFTQSVVPIGCVLFILCQFLSTPFAWARMIAGRDIEAEEIEREIEKCSPSDPMRPFIDVA